MWSFLSIFIIGFTSIYGIISMAMDCFAAMKLTKEQKQKLYRF